MDIKPIHVDGNALAGPLAEAFGADLTGAVIRCNGCEATAVMAACEVYRSAPGLVVRCPACGQVQMRIVGSGDRMWLDVQGISSIQMDGSR